MRSMFLSFIFSSLLYVNLFAAGCCSSCNSCKKPTHTDSGKGKHGLQLNITDDNIKLNNNVIQPIPVDDIPNNIVKSEYKSNITFYELTKEQFNSSITPTVDLCNDTQYIIAKIETEGDKYYLLKIIIKNSNTERKPEFKANRVFFTRTNSTVTKITILDSSKNITSLEGIFSGCNNLAYVDLSKLNTQNVTNMNAVFFGCEVLTNLDLSSFNTEKVTNMSCMFYNCQSLKELDFSSFDTKNVEDMSWMFGYCSSLKGLNLSAFNTEKVGNMSCMFYKCSALEKLNLSRFNFTSVESVSEMFNRCSALKTFVAPQQLSYGKGDDVDFSDVFKSCDNLKLNGNSNIGAISTFDEFISVLKNNS